MVIDADLFLYCRICFFKIYFYGNEALVCFWEFFFSLQVIICANSLIKNLNYVILLNSQIVLFFFKKNEYLV
jgi:hypothetical protein